MSTTEEMRGLAARMGLLKECEVCAGRGWIGRPQGALGQFDSCTCPGAACVAGHRLPTEAETRAAIRAAGWPVAYVKAQETFVQAVICRPSEERQGSAIASEATPDDLVLLALLRALEVARG